MIASILATVGPTKGGMNTKQQAVTDAIGRPILLFLTAGQANDYTEARALVDNILKMFLIIKSKK